jgi:hypothetical protein
MFKDEGTTFVDWCESFIRKLNISDKSICVLLRTLHFTMPIVTGTIMLIGSKMWFNIIVVFNIIVFILFFIFHGCILSKIEHRFTDDEFTVIDPFLELIHVELTNENRSKYSLYSSIMGFILTYGLYCYRFGGSLPVE